MNEYLQAVLWGLVQGLTEFLPVSSSGHLVLVPEVLGVDPPDLALSAVLHLGSLAAIVAHYRRDLARLLRSFVDPAARRLLWLLVVGTLPAGLALVVRDQVDALQQSTTAVGIALIGTGIVLWVSSWLRDRLGTLDEAGYPTALVVGFSQLLAIIPGVSRAGMTITAGMARGLAPSEAARFSFLLGVPAIAAAGLLEGVGVVGDGRLDGPLVAGVVTAGLSGYLAISWLLRILERSGLRPFSYYCFVVGVAAIVFL